MAQDTRIRSLVGLLALASLVALWPSAAVAHSCAAPFETALLADGDIELGIVQVCNDESDLHVTYVINDALWCMTKTNLHVADSLAGIPQNRHGKPITGRFDYKNNHHPCTGHFGITIALGDWQPATELFVAANATVSDKGGHGPKSDAWGDGTAFPDDHGATYFTYDIQEPYLCGVDDSRCVFVASGFFSADLVSAASDLLGTTPSDSLAAGDALCQHFAQAQDSEAAPGPYVAWLSTSGDAIRDRLITPSGPYRLVDGTEVVQHGADITAGTLENGIDRDQTGQLYLHGVQVWTGTSPTGDSTGQDCDSWSSTSAAVGATHGLEGLDDGRWTDNGNFDCGAQLTLYCFQQVER